MEQISQRKAHQKEDLPNLRRAPKTLTKSQFRADISGSKAGPVQPLRVTHCEEADRLRSRQLRANRIHSTRKPDWALNTWFKAIFQSTQSSCFSSVFSSSQELSAASKEATQRRRAFRLRPWPRALPGACSYAPPCSHLRHMAYDMRLWVKDW